jgi:minor extracellular serine protease Vpr
LRRLVFLCSLVAALTGVSQAASTPQPIRRHLGELTIPRLRAGTVHVPAGHGRGEIRVIVRLRPPPLAAYSASRSLQITGSTHRLNVGSRSSRAYLAHLEAVQRRAAAELERAIPSARISRRFRILLDGLTMTLPNGQLPRLVRLGFVSKVYPSLTYMPTTNESPSIIAADALRQRTGAQGDGMKIGVVDTGIDQTNPFLNGSGMDYPPGFPRGGIKWTSSKVIVARTFPGPGSGRRGRRAVDPTEPHGTHVSGIAAGRSGTDAPGSRDRPPVNGLSGVAPRAWLGNYRVFTVPTPYGASANTPEIVAAFEAAVRDGMNVINFSGGGPQTDPANDALIEAVRNVSNAGVVPVISAGNDRDEFGGGTVGSPGVAPDAISVAAVSNKHVFAPALTLDSPQIPGLPKQVPFEQALAPSIPPSWGTVAQPIVDIGTIVGRDGTGVDRKLCGPPEDPNGSFNPLPRGSLMGAIALVSRGYCSFTSKADRVKEAGAKGMVLVNNRSGEANIIPVELSVPSGMISDLDGERLRTALAGSFGRGLVRIGNDVEQIQTDRSGVVTYFSSVGPTAFGHQLKPDVAAPGGEVLSSVTRLFNRSQFDVFDGTSMAAPHVSGAAALLLELHPGWTPEQVKSALVSTAGAAWANTARTVEAPVTLEGGGLVDVDAAAEPRIFTEPASLSFGDLNVTRGGARSAQLVTLTDAGGGAGTWQVDIKPQSASAGARLDLPPAVDVAPGGIVELPVAAVALGGATAGDDYGFVVLRRGDEIRRIPYLFLVTRPGLQTAAAKPLKRNQLGSTRFGPSRVDVYRYPTWPFGPPLQYPNGETMNEGGAEKLYTRLVKRPVVNIGVSVIAASRNSIIDPWLLGTPDENDVQGYAGTPVDVNSLTFDYHFDIGAAGAVFPLQKRYYVSVDSGSDPYTGKQYPGRYLLRSWVNDVKPPSVRLVTTRVAAGRPLLIARVLDSGAGVDPYSLVIGYQHVLVGASAYDPFSGLAFFPLPGLAPALRAGNTHAILIASDYQEAKNVATVGRDLTPNTAYKPALIRGSRGPAVTWIVPRVGACVRGKVRLVVAASSTRRITSVRFSHDGRPIARVARGTVGLYIADWATGNVRLGRHTLRAMAQDARGRRYAASLPVRVCK